MHECVRMNDWALSGCAEDQAMRLGALISSSNEFTAELAHVHTSHPLLLMVALPLLAPC